MSEHWPVSNEGVGMPPQPLERENARLKAEVERMRTGWDADVDWANKLLSERDEARAENARLRKALRDIDAYWIAGWPDEDDVAVIGDIARAALREGA